jgi:hypothetical protein
MKRGGVGGAKTQKEGAYFEESTAQSLIEDFLLRGYRVINETRANNGKGTLHGQTLKDNKGKTLELFYQDGIYKLFFEPNGIKWQDKHSQRLKPDTAIFSPEKKVLTIVEKKQQNTEGSVAEKLQTCDYKIQYYRSLAEPLNISVELVWLLGPYFENKKDSLRSVFEYMESKGSRYYFKKIPLENINL